MRELGVYWVDLSLFSSIVLFLIHPLIQRPNHSSTYLCTFQNPWGWVGPSLMTISVRNYLYTFVIVSSWYISKKLKPLSIQTTKVVSSNNLSHSISNAYNVKLKKVFKTRSKCTPRFNHKSKMLCIPLHFVEYLSIIHTMYLKEDDTQNLLLILWRICLTCAHATNQVQREG